MEISRKKVIYGSVAFLITFTFMVGCSDYRQKKEMEKIVHVNSEVHNLLEYGDASGDINDVLKGGIGHCGHYVIVMSYKLKEMGIDCSMIDVKSNTWNAAHSVIECEVLGEKYIFDPTVGIYYKNSLEELIENPELAKNYIAQTAVKNDFFMYIVPEFWSGVNQTIVMKQMIYRNPVNYDYYMNGLKNCSFAINTIQFQDVEIEYDALVDNDWETYQLFSVNPDTGKVCIELQFERDIYGILAIDFFDCIPSISDIEVFCYDGTNEIQDSVEFVTKKESQFEYFLADRNVDRINLVISSDGLDEIAINELILTDDIIMN